MMTPWSFRVVHILTFLLTSQTSLPLSDPSVLEEDAMAQATVEREHGRF